MNGDNGRPQNVTRNWVALLLGLSTILSLNACSRDTEPGGKTGPTAAPTPSTKKPEQQIILTNPRTVAAPIPQPTIREAFRTLECSLVESFLGAPLPRSSATLMDADLTCALNLVPDPTFAKSRDPLPTEVVSVLLLPGVQPAGLLPDASIGDFVSKSNGVALSIISDPSGSLPSYPEVSDPANGYSLLRIGGNEGVLARVSPELVTATWTGGLSKSGTSIQFVAAGVDEKAALALVTSFAGAEPVLN